jgi:hypothetical protein
VLDALGRDLDPGERVHRRDVLAGAGRGDERAGDVPEQRDADVHLQHREAAALALQQPLAHLLRVGHRRRVGVAPHGVAELPADQGVRRHAVRLAGQVHQGHLDAGHATALAAVVPELLDLAEDLVEVARVLADDAALEREGVRGARAVAHLAPADEPLVRVDPDDRRAERHPEQVGHPHIGDAQVAGPRRGADVLLADRARTHEFSLRHCWKSASMSSAQVWTSI